eukprot:639614-Amphidinium_carterae.1
MERAQTLPHLELRFVRLCNDMASHGLGRACSFKIVGVLLSLETRLNLYHVGRGHSMSLTAAFLQAEV